MLIVNYLATKINNCAKLRLSTSSVRFHFKGAPIQHSYSVRKKKYYNMLKLNFILYTQIITIFLNLSTISKLIVDRGIPTISFISVTQIQFVRDK